MPEPGGGEPWLPLQRFSQSLPILFGYMERGILYVQRVSTWKDRPMLRATAKYTCRFEAKPRWTARVP